MHRHRAKCCCPPPAPLGPCGDCPETPTPNTVHVLFANVVPCDCGLWNGHPTWTHWKWIDLPSIDVNRPAGFDVVRNDPDWVCRWVFQAEATGTIGLFDQYVRDADGKALCDDENYYPVPYWPEGVSPIANTGCDGVPVHQIHITDLVVRVMAGVYAEAFYVTDYDGGAFDVLAFAATIDQGDGDCFPQSCADCNDITTDHECKMNFSPDLGHGFYGGDVSITVPT